MENIISFLRETILSICGRRYAKSQGDGIIDGQELFQRELLTQGNCSGVIA